MGRPDDGTAFRRLVRHEEEGRDRRTAAASAVVPSQRRSTQQTQPEATQLLLLADNEQRSRCRCYNPGPGPDRVDHIVVDRAPRDPHHQERPSSRALESRVAPTALDAAPRRTHLRRFSEAVEAAASSINHANVAEAATGSRRPSPVAGTRFALVRVERVKSGQA